MTSMYNWFVHSKKKINFLSSLTAKYKGFLIIFQD